MAFAASWLGEEGKEQSMKGNQSCGPQDLGSSCPEDFALASGGSHGVALGRLVQRVVLAVLLLSLAILRTTYAIATTNAYPPSSVPEQEGTAQDQGDREQER